jgi:fumarylpyruvate hydrolase
MADVFSIAHTVLPIRGETATFPVRRIYCVGRNYADHAVEMGHNPQREPPFFFSKPADAIVVDGASIAYPRATQDLHHEIELVVAIGVGGADITEADALKHVFGYAVGIDLTRRDIQAEAKKLARPWDLAKGFDQSAPMSALRRASEIGHPVSGRIWLAVNREQRQQGDLAQQIWAVPETIAFLSRFVRLEPGDLIMTGTPAGVGAIEIGDSVTGGIDGIGEVSVRFLPRG